MAAIGVDGDDAVTRAPSGGAVTESLWLIQHDLLVRRLLEERAALGVELRLAELGGAGALDLAAEVPGHRLHAVADAERRDAELAEPRIELGRAVGVDGRRAAARG